MTDCPTSIGRAPFSEPVLDHTVHHRDQHTKRLSRNGRVCLLAVQPLWLDDRLLASLPTSATADLTLEAGMVCTGFFTDVNSVKLTVTSVWCENEINALCSACYNPREGRFSMLASPLSLAAKRLKSCTTSVRGEGEAGSL